MATVRNVNRFGKKLTAEQMLRQFKKKVEKEGILKDMRKHEEYTKPSVAKKLKSKLARQRVAKEEAKKAAYAARYDN